MNAYLFWVIILALQKRGKFVDVSLKKKRVAHSNAKVVNADEYLYMYTAAGDLYCVYTCFSASGCERAS